MNKFVPGNPLPFPRNWGEVSAAAYGAELEGVVDDARSAAAAIDWLPKQAVNAAAAAAAAPAAAAAAAFVEGAWPEWRCDAWPVGPCTSSLFTSTYASSIYYDLVIFEWVQGPTAQVELDKALV